MMASDKDTTRLAGPGGYPAPPSYPPPPAYPSTGYPEGYSQGYPQGGYPSQGYPPHPPSGEQQPNPPVFAYSQPYWSQHPNQDGYRQGFNTVYPSGAYGSEQPSGSVFSETADSAETGGPTPQDWQGFSDRAIRQGFIRKVYAILMAQLAFTVAIIMLFIFEPTVKRYVQTHMALYIAAYIAFLVLYIALACCPGVRRKWPSNIIVLILFTLAMTYLVATISSFHSTNIVLITLGICSSCCLAITLFSFHTKFDITSWGGALFILCWVLFMFGIVAIFTYNAILNTIYAALGALLFMAMLAYNTQMVVGGKKYQLSPEEYIFGALQLYLDVIYIFLFLLSLMGGAKRG